MIRRPRLDAPGVNSFAAVGVGLAVLGLAAYAFLVFAGRALGPDDFGLLSVVWMSIFTLGPGFFIPLEQEVSRAVAARRASGLGGLPVFRRAMRLDAMFVGGLIGLLVIASPAIVPGLLRGQVSLLLGALVALIAFSVAYPSRGVLAGTGRFARYGAQLTIEGLARIAIAAALLVWGSATVGWYGLGLGLPTLIGALCTAPRAHRYLTDGPPAPTAELSDRLGTLLGTSLLGAVVVNTGAVAVETLSDEADRDRAGAFLSAIIVARAMLFLFAAVQAVLLPQLTTHAARGEIDMFVAVLRRVVVAVGGVGVVGTIACGAVGPWALQVVFGSEFVVSRPIFTTLALASGVYMVALVLTQAVVALDRHRATLGAWAASAVSQVLVLGVTARVSLWWAVAVGFLVAAVVATVVLARCVHVIIRASLGSVPDERAPAPLAVDDSLSVEEA